MRRAKRALFLSALIASACTKAPIPPKDKPAPEPAKTLLPSASSAPPPVAIEKEKPPALLPARPFAVPKSNWAELGNGLSLASRPHRGLPLVHFRFAVLAGSVVDGEQTGLARVCANASAHALQTALDPLGATISTDVNADRIVLRATVQSAHWQEALKRAAPILIKPAPLEKEIRLVQEDLAARADRLARQNGQFGAMMMLAQDLFLLPSEHHPYASYDAQGDEIRKIKPSDCRPYYRRYFAPQSALIAATGDLRHEDFKKAVEGSFGAWRGKPSDLETLTDPLPPESSKITLVDMPTQKHPEIVVGTLGPRQDEPGFGPFLLATEILGGDARGRLFQALQEKKELATSAFSRILPFASGPSLFYSYARTTEATFSETLQSLLDALSALSREAPTEAESQQAIAALHEKRALLHADPEHGADELCDLWMQKTPDEAPIELLRKLSDSTPVSITKFFSEHVRQGHYVVVVAADAAAVGPKLQAFGEVKVVDPGNHFTRLRTLPEARVP